MLLEKTGKNAELKPIISNGSISLLRFNQKGKNYQSAPDLEVVGIGTGLGAKLRAVVENGKIIDVVILEGGLQYQEDTTSIVVNHQVVN